MLYRYSSSNSYVNFKSVVDYSRFNKYVILFSNPFLVFEKAHSQKLSKSPFPKINAALVNDIYLNAFLRSCFIM